jgi:predicted phosphoribosyltransferase
MRFHDRADAGRALAVPLAGYRGRSDVLVLALPRGGVLVGFELARELGLPLDAYLVRKLGVPGHEELAMGALASDGTRVLNDVVIGRLGITDETIASATASEGRELQRRERAYRGDRPAVDVRGRTIILVDDGVATGASIRVAARALRARAPDRLVLAVPVGPRSVCDELLPLADEVVCLDPQERFRAVGAAYDEFSQGSDAEVRELLERARGARHARE